MSSRGQRSAKTARSALPWTQITENFQGDGFQVLMALTIRVLHSEQLLLQLATVWLLSLGCPDPRGFSHLSVVSHTSF